MRSWRLPNLRFISINRWLNHCWLLPNPQSPRNNETFTGTLRFNEFELYEFHIRTYAENLYISWIQTCVLVCDINLFTFYNSTYLVLTYLFANCIDMRTICPLQYRNIVSNQQTTLLVMCNAHDNIINLDIQATTKKITECRFCYVTHSFANIVHEMASK